MGGKGGPVPMPSIGDVRPEKGRLEIYDSLGRMRVSLGDFSEGRTPHLRPPSPVIYRRHCPGCGAPASNLSTCEYCRSPLC